MIKRAWIYLIRKYKRSILLLLLLLVISLGISVGFSIWNSINAVTKDVEQSLGTSIVLKVSRVTTQNEMYRMDNLLDADGDSTYTYGGPSLTDEIIQQIMNEVDGISHYNADNYMYCHLDELQLYPGFFAETIDMYQENRAEHDQIDYELAIMYSRVATVYGNTDSSLDNRFRTGSLELVEGRHLRSETDHGKVLISDELAERNGLKPGDTFHVSVRAGMAKNKHPLKRWGEPTKLEIIGIFHVNGYQPASIWVGEFNSTYNHIFADTDTVKHLNRVGYAKDIDIPELTYENVTFFVDDPARLPELLEQMKNLTCIDTQYYDIAIDDTMYKSTVEPLHSIRNLVTGLALAITLGCAIVLCIVFTMWVRSRRQEIAVYLSIGMGRPAILGQFVLEAGMVALLAGVLSFAACQQLPNLIGNRMLAAAIEDSGPDAKEPTREEIHQAAMSGTVHELFTYETGDYAGPEHINFSFRIADFAVLLLLELLIITAAICRAGWFILEMQPRQIMTAFR